MEESEEALVAECTAWSRGAHPPQPPRVPDEMAHRIKRAPDRWLDAMLAVIAATEDVNAVDELAGPLTAVLEADASAVGRLGSLAAADDRVAYALYLATLGTDVSLYRAVGHDPTVASFIRNALARNGFAFWGWEAVMAVVWDGRELEAGWAIVQDLVEQTSDRRVLALIGAGPLEDFIDTHSASVAERIAKAARASSRFAQTICLAHLPADMPEAGKELITAAVRQSQRAN